MNYIQKFYHFFLYYSYYSKYSIQYSLDDITQPFLFNINCSDFNINIKNLYPDIVDQLYNDTNIINIIFYAYQYLSVNKLKIDDIKTFSRLYIYKLEKYYNNLNSISSYINIFNLYNILPEDYFEYNDTNYNINFNNINNFQNNQYYIMKLNLYYYHNPIFKKFNFYKINQNLQDIKNSLFIFCPIIFFMKIYDNFYSDQKNIIQIPNNYNSYLDNICALCVGFNDNTKLFFIKLSFGTDFGLNGYIYLSYDYLLNKDLCSDFYIMN